MDTDGRGWVFRRGVGGTDFGSAYTAGWILNNGVWQANASMRAPIFYDSQDTGFYLDPNSYSRLSRVGVGGGANDVSGININGDAGITSSNFFYFGHSNGSLGSWQTRTFASSGRQIWNTNGFEVNRDGYGGGWSVSINSAGSTTFNSSSDLPININGASHKYLTINPGNGYEAMVRYIGGSGSSWYVGKRTSGEGGIGTGDFHFYAEASARTVVGINASGYIYAHGYHGNQNVAGTGAASFHPSGVYSTGTNWLYGTMYLNVNSINDANNIYNYGWYRNYNQTGLYNQTYNGHIVKMENLYWSIDNGGQGTTFGLQFRHNYNSTIYGYVYGDTSGQFGLLNGGSWAVRTTSGGGQLYGGWSVSGSITIDGWFYNNGATGLYFNNSGNGVWSPESEGNPYGNIATYGTGRNGWRGYGVGSQFTFMGRTSVDVGLHDTGYGWIWYSPYGSGRLSVGTSSSSSSYRLYVDGAIYATNDIVAFSDARKKTNITTIDKALETVTKMRGVFYDKINEENKGRQLGVIAQEVNEILPEAVNYSADTDEYGVKYGNMAGLFIEAIKELNAKIANLEAQLASK
jgi:hypothetical protein